MKFSVPRRIRMAGVLGAVVVAFAQPIGAAPSIDLASGFDPLVIGPICHARSPVMAHPYARNIAYVSPGTVQLAAAPAEISNEDHAELMFKLGLLEGHLMIGKELIDAGQPRAALPHFGHPMRELYEDISPLLAPRGVTPFDTELIALEALVAAKPTDPATTAKYDQVVKILAAVRATVPQGLTNSEPFMLGVLADITNIGSEDYNESIEAGKIAKPVEYHDSRGYLEYASAELARLEHRPELAGSKKLAAFRAELTRMQAIVGPLLPPTKPIKSVADYKVLVAKARAIAQG